MAEMGEITGFEEKGGKRTAAVVTTDDGKEVTGAYDRRHHAFFGLNSAVKFSKKPLNTFGFPNQGDRVALERTPCGKHIERWGVIAQNTAARRGGNGAEH
jgi:hypothetical protein